MTLSSLLAAVMAVCAWLSFPAGAVSVTLQTFGAALTLLLLGGKWGSVSLGIYLLLGAVGAPVFSGFQGGPGVLLGASGGFLWGFLLWGLIYRLLESFGKIFALIAGLLGCYLCGCCWFGIYSGGGLWAIVSGCVLPYLVPDAAKLYLAYLLSRRLSRVIKLPSRA